MQNDKAPERIWLQIEDDDDGSGWDAAGNATTWCEDKINEGDIEYIRADLVEIVLKQTIERIEADPIDEYGLYVDYKKGFADGAIAACESMLGKVRESE